MKSERNTKLPTFLSFSGLPKNDKEKKRVLQSPIIKEIYIYALGPEGTNIHQASKKWAERMGATKKTKIFLCDTPEESLKRAREVKKKGVLAVFWTCAVYVKEYQMFFKNPDVLLFFFEEVMLLDEMQLASREENLELSPDMKIASHPSPSPLAKELVCEIILVNSNSAAAKLCKEGEVDVCITTEEARRINGLFNLHSFGSPPMVFFGGITKEGAEIIKEALDSSGFI